MMSRTATVMMTAVTNVLRSRDFLQLTKEKQFFNFISLVSKSFGKFGKVSSYLKLVTAFGEGSRIM